MRKNYKDGNFTYNSLILASLYILCLFTNLHTQWEYAGFFSIDTLKLDHVITQLYSITGIAVDGEGNVWFAPYYYSERKIDANELYIKVPHNENGFGL